MLGKLDLLKNLFFVEISETSSPTVCPVKARRKKAYAWHLVAGWLTLVLFFLEFSPAGICASAIIGSFDSTHEAGVQSGESGLQLVLHHGHGCVGHHHGLVARTLTLLAQSATATNPDHIIQFGSGDNFSSQTHKLLPTLAQAGQEFSAINEIPSTVPNPTWATTREPRPPPPEFGKLTCLRSTVFLI